MSEWPDTEQVLSRFRHWLDQTRNEVDSCADETLAADTTVESLGAYQLAERLTALRHEIKLLTKAARSGEERQEATLLSMQAAIEQFRAAEANETRAAEQAARPLVEALVDLDESLCRGWRAIKNAQRRVKQETTSDLEELRDRFECLFRAQPWWRRALCRHWHQAIKDVYSDRTLGNQHRIFDSLLEGYELIQSRLQRALDEQSILRMECLGRQVDPHSMTVVETVREPGRPAGQVVEEVRTGYYWNSKVFRFAEVKVIGE